MTNTLIGVTVAPIGDALAQIRDNATPVIYFSVQRQAPRPLLQSSSSLLISDGVEG